jgi:inositol phosphorylceramide mannosyltransferase catalytic subunit
MFPKIIHQIWYQGRDKIPEKLSKNAELLRSFHPEWKYILWDDKMIKKFFKNNEKILTTYNNLEYLHQKVDFIRYCILYEIGGVYVDMDVTTLKSMDQLLDEYFEYECLVSNIRLNVFESYIFSKHKECINNGVIVCKAKSNYMLNLINSIHRDNKCRRFENKSMCINRTTGPYLFTKIYNQYEFKDNIKVLDWSYFEPCLLGDICEVKDNTILIHHHDATWISGMFTKIAYGYLKHKNISILKKSGKNEKII